MRKSNTLLLNFCALLITIGTCTFESLATTQSQTVFINSGNYVAIDGTIFPRYAYNSTASFNGENSRVRINNTDTLQLMVINNDSVLHGFDIKNISGVQTTINPTDTAIITVHFPNEGVYIYYDHLNAPAYAYLGLSSMIIADNFAGPEFHWNIKDHQKSYNDSLFAGASVDWTTYYPDYFVINGRSNPEINTDAAARITGSVGQTIRLYIANTGLAIHSMHFHGYHLEIIHSSDRPATVGRSKDTFPIQAMEVLILELIPDKPGEYPVHDHNLVATTGGGIYPSGMFTTMLIQ
jgi:FtsP/CotA-like multicopper oxidase with cupredoxin domain